MLVISQLQFDQGRACQVRAFYNKLDMYLSDALPHWPGDFDTTWRLEQIARWHGHATAYCCETEQEIAGFAELCGWLRCDNLSAEEHDWYVLQLCAEGINRARVLDFLCDVARQKSSRKARG